MGLCEAVIKLSDAILISNVVWEISLFLGLSGIIIALITYFIGPTLPGTLLSLVGGFLSNKGVIYLINFFAKMCMS